MSLNTALWSLKNIKMRSQDGKTYDIPDIEIFKGDHLAIVGENRELRRALFRMLSGMEAPFEGELKIEGSIIPTRKDRNPWGDLVPHNTRRKMGVGLERDGLLSNVSVRECLETLFRFKYGDHNESLVAGAQKAAKEVSQKMGLCEREIDKRPSELSPLNRRLASLCLAFMTKPSILMLENPSFALPDEGWAVLSKILDGILKGSQRTFVMDSDDWLFARAHTNTWIMCHDSGEIEMADKEDFISRNSSRLKQILNSEKYQGWSQWLADLNGEIEKDIA